MKTNLRIRTKWVLALSPVATAVFLICCYDVAADARRAETGDAKSAPGVSLTAQTPDLVSRAHDNDSEYLERRRDYLNRFFGPPLGNISPDAYMTALAAARALPPSPLLRGHKFMSTQAPSPLTPLTPSWPSWTFPILPPISSAAYGNSGAMVQAVAPHPTRPLVVYIGSDAGLARSEDGGQTWQYLSDDWDAQQVNAIAINPNYPDDNIWVGTGRDNPGVGVYCTLDGGASWGLGPSGANELGGSTIRAIAVDPNPPGENPAVNVYVANGGKTNSGLWRSLNTGVTWEPVGPRSTTGTFGLAIDASKSPSTIYVANGGGVYKSTNSGNSWGDPIYPANWYATPWARLSVVNSVIYLLNPSNGLLYKSADAGDTWAQIPTPCPPAGPGGPEWVCAEGAPIPISVFAVDPSNPQVILGGDVLLFRTENGLEKDATWINIGQPGAGELHCDERALAFSSAQAGLVYSGNDGGVAKSTQYGQQTTWENLNAHLPGALLYSVGISPDDSMVAGTQDNGAVFSYRSASWASVWSGDSGHNLIEPNPANGNTMYFTEKTNTLMRVRNPGAPGEAWNSIYPAVGTPFHTELTNGTCGYLPPFSMNPLVQTNLVFGCQRVFRNVNPAVSPGVWTAIGGQLGGGGPLNAVFTAYEAPSNPQVIYASTGENKIYVTINANAGGSAGWTNITNGLPAGTVINAISVDSHQPGTAYVAGNSGVFKTTNTGGAWSNLNAPANLVYSALALDPDNPTYVFAACRAGVYATINGGVSWENMSDAIPKGMSFTALTFNHVSRQLAAATYGRGAYVLNLDNVPPTVSLIPPPFNGSSVAGTVQLSAFAADNHRVAGVQFQLDGANLYSEETNAPYAVGWNTSLATGSHTLTAIARDAAGNTTTSASITVTVDNTAPTGSVTWPPNGATVSGTLPVSATASDNIGVAGVQFKLDGYNLYDEDTTAPYSVSWNTSLLLGSHTLTAVVRDAAGNTTTSAPVTVTIDNMGPTVSINSPANGASVSGTVSVSATASDNIGVVGVQFKLDGFNLGNEDTTAPYSVSWNTMLLLGSHTLTAVARDAAGNTTTSAPITGTIDNTAPTVSITSPAAGDVEGAITVSATASDNVGVVGVLFNLDGADLAGEDTDAPFAVTWKTYASRPGSHTLTAVARDAAGNTTTSAPVTVWVVEQ